MNLFMDYETFGEHQWPETGIFDFLRALPRRVFSNSNYEFHTPHELSKLFNLFLRFMCLTLFHGLMKNVTSLHGWETTYRMMLQ